MKILPFVLVFSFFIKKKLFQCYAVVNLHCYIPTGMFLGSIQARYLPISGFGGLKWTFGNWLLRNQVAKPFALDPLQDLVGSNGLGPSTSRLSGVCSNQLSYEPICGGGNRVRTDDFLLAGQALYQLSYTPILCSSQNKCPPFS